VTMTPSETTVDFRVIDTFDIDAVAVTKQSYRVAVGELPEGICDDVPPRPTTTVPDGSVEPAASPATPATAPPASPVAGQASYTG
jgi:hypothetical protein